MVPTTRNFAGAVPLLCVLPNGSIKFGFPALTQSSAEGRSSAWRGSPEAKSPQITRKCQQMLASPRHGHHGRVGKYVDRLRRPHRQVQQCEVHQWQRKGNRHPAQSRHANSLLPVVRAGGRFRAAPGESRLGLESRWRTKWIGHIILKSSGPGL